MRETSLEDFVDETEGSTEADPSDDGSGEDPSDDRREAVSTYAWTPGGRACPACGSVVERRWRDGDELVCADCVSW